MLVDQDRVVLDKSVESIEFTRDSALIFRKVDDVAERAAELVRSLVRSKDGITTEEGLEIDPLLKYHIADPLEDSMFKNSRIPKGSTVHILSSHTSYELIGVLNVDSGLCNTYHLVEKGKLQH